MLLLGQTRRYSVDSVRFQSDHGEAVEAEYLGLGVMKERTAVGKRRRTVFMLSEFETYAGTGLGAPKFFCDGMRSATAAPTNIKTPQPIIQSTSKLILANDRTASEATNRGTR